jgi:hypothetical protein
MNAIDLFIIYLACGAPFGVYYFFQNRSPEKSKLFWIKTLFNFLFWIPFAFAFLRHSGSFKILSPNKSAETSLKPAVEEAKVHSIVKQIEKLFLASDLKISVYQWRETIERYIGLTFAIRTDALISDAETDFFRIGERDEKRIELGAKCLNRRNRKRLLFHQIEARKDFLHLINQLIEFHSEREDLQRSATELLQTLADFEALDEFKRMSGGVRQTEDRFGVSESEQDLWKPETPKLSPAKQIS